MQLVMKLKPISTNNFDGTQYPTSEEEREALRNVALEIQQMNIALESLLVNGPFQCNPDSEAYEGYLGDINTRPNEFGYIRVNIPNYRKIILPPGIAPTTFEFVYGEPVEDIVDSEGNILQVYGGDIM